MTTPTIAVPRELLERVAKPVETQYDRDQRWKALVELRALLTAQPQASRVLEQQFHNAVTYGTSNPEIYDLEQASAAQSAPAGERDDEREAFEAVVRLNWASAPLHYVRDALPKDDPRYGQYVDETLQGMWVGWQGRAAWQRTQLAGVSDGYALVPVVITDAMADAAGDEGTPTLTPHAQSQRRWSAMLAAAPAQPAARDHGEVQRLREALENLAGAARSINIGRNHKITVPDDDQPVYWQREEWVRYVLQLVYEADAALAASTGQEE